MSEETRDDEQSIGHDSTTAPGGNKDRSGGDPGRTPDTAEGSRETVEEDLRQKGIE
jgi:hypothetical protein